MDVDSELHEVVCVVVLDMRLGVVVVKLGVMLVGEEDVRLVGLEEDVRIVELLDVVVVKPTVVCEVGEVELDVLVLPDDGAEIKKYAPNATITTTIRTATATTRLIALLWSFNSLGSPPFALS
jgi:hypothetical protein